LGGRNFGSYVVGTDVLVGQRCADWAMNSGQLPGRGATGRPGAARQHVGGAQRPVGPRHLTFAAIRRLTPQIALPVRFWLPVGTDTPLLVIGCQTQEPSSRFLPWRAWPAVVRRCRQLMPATTAILPSTSNLRLPSLPGEHCAIVTTSFLFRFVLQVAILP
jgi:hypothetical protein